MESNPCTAPFLQPKKFIQTKGTLVLSPSCRDSNVSNSRLSEHDSCKSTSRGWKELLHPANKTPGSECQAKPGGLGKTLCISFTRAFIYSTALSITWASTLGQSWQLLQKQRGQFWSCYFNCTKKGHWKNTEKMLLSHFFLFPMQWKGWEWINFCKLIFPMQGIKIQR